jgi:malate dehydrogenase (oxaloacetate-decarboxylating)
VLIGVTAQAGLFDEPLLEQMASNAERPVVMALSNPTSKSECELATVVRATQGRGLMASGSPFAPVPWQDRTLCAAQCNNLFVFPGMGLGALLARASKVTDTMFTAASQALSDLVSAGERAQGRLLPEVANVREAAARVAVAVARTARDEGIGRQLDDARIEELVRKAQWVPHFAPYRPGTRSGGSTA